MSRAWAGFILAGALLASAPTGAGAQVFLATASRPDFTIGPLFVVAVAPADVQAPMSITVSWNLVGRAGRAPARQDLLLYWPSEIASATAPGVADGDLVRYVEARGYAAGSSGRLALRRRRTSQIGTATPTEALPVTATFVSFMRRDAPAQTGVGTLVRIPWTPELGDTEWLLALTLPVRGMIGAKPATWLEEVFWGRRNVLAIGWGDLGSFVFYPLYHEQRERVVRLAPEYTRLIATFPGAEHLRLEGIEPASAVRRVSLLRADTETVSMPISTAADAAPQMLKVQYAYYRGVFAWRPVLISAGLLLLGNLAGLWMVSGEVRRLVRARVRLGRAAADGGPDHLAPERLAQIRPGESTRDDVVRLCGEPDEHHRRVTDGGRRTLVYRATHRRPARGLSVGWLATVRHWDIEQHEVEIELDGDLVQDVVIRVRRARANSPD